VTRTATSASAAAVRLESGILESEKKFLKQQGIKNEKKQRKDNRNPAQVLLLPRGIFGVWLKCLKT